MVHMLFFPFLTNMSRHVCSTHPFRYCLMHVRDLGKWRAGSVRLSLSLGKRKKKAGIAAVTFSLSSSPSLGNHQTHWQHPIREYEHGSDPPINCWLMTAFCCGATHEANGSSRPAMLSCPCNMWFHVKWGLLHLYNMLQREGCEVFTGY